MNEQRVARVRAEMQAHGLTQMIISDSKSIWYLTGASVEPYERLMALYLPVQGEPVIFLNKLFFVPQAPCREVWHTDSDKPVEQIAEVVDKTKTLGIDKEWPAKFLIPLMELCPGMPVVLASDCVDACRAVKDAEEQMLMKEASRINDETILKARDYVKPGMTERQVAAELVYNMLKNGSEGNSFDPIVVTGSKTSLPHGVPGDKVIQSGDFVTMDFGSIKHGYCSDMTRTVAVGSASEEMRNVYDTVLRAQLAGIAAAKAGVPGKEIDAAARKVISDAGYGKYFGHGFGHSLGLDIHEWPNANPSGETPMPAGAVCSAEPGIYIPGRFGVRIEDVMVIREGGAEIITKAPKELVVL